jgi:hypothetical protein
MYIYEIGCMTYFYKQGTPEMAITWRKEVDAWAKSKKNVNTFNPSKAYNMTTLDLNTLGNIGVDQNDYFLKKCDVALCNLLMIERSPGSIYELTTCKKDVKPIIAFGIPSWSPHIMSCISCVVPDLPQALSLIEHMFL